MQNVLANFLFQYKHCTLPSVGSIQIVTKAPTYIFGEQIMEGLQSSLHFSTNEKDGTKLLSFIAVQKNIDSDVAEELLNTFAKSIKNLPINQTFVWPNVGIFSKINNDDISFEAIPESAIFYPSVTAARVTHPNASHSMVVGETHTNTTDMALQLATKAAPNFFKVWLAAIVLFATAIAIIIFYLVSNKAFNHFGNATKFIPTTRTITYRSY